MRKYPREALVFLTDPESNVFEAHGFGSMGVLGEFVAGRNHRWRVDARILRPMTSAASEFLTLAMEAANV